MREQAHIFEYSSCVQLNYYHKNHKYSSTSAILPYGVLWKFIVHIYQKPTVFIQHIFVFDAGETLWFLMSLMTSHKIP